MSDLREPLPYPHNRGPFDHGWPAACATPEDPSSRRFTGWQCSGCMAYRMAVTLAAPYGHFTNTRTGESVARIEAVRTATDDTDPMRVLFERALAERGIG